MKVTYRPESGPAQEFDYHHGRVRVSEAEVLEKRLDGIKWDAFEAEILQGSARARRVLLWHLLRRDHLGLKYEDTPDFAMDELLVEMGSEDSKRLRARMASMPPTPQVHDAIEALDAAIIDQEAAEAAKAAEGATGGKAASKKNATATG